MRWRVQVIFAQRVEVGQRVGADRVPRRQQVVHARIAAGVFARLRALHEQISAWGPCAGCPEDLNGNGNVDFADILELLAVWGPCP